jgi:hypothetical protein
MLSFLASIVTDNSVLVRGVHGPVRSGFNPKIQPNRKIVFLINITRTEPRTGSNRTGFVRFGSVF